MDAASSNVGARQSLLQADVPPLIRETGPARWHLAPDSQKGPALAPGLRVLIGGVGYWWQRDASFGLVAVDALAAGDWPPGVRLAKLDYGALYVLQDLEEVQPSYDRLVLLAGKARGRDPGQLYSRRWVPAPLDEQEIQERIREAGAGVIDVDHLLTIGQYFGLLPDDIHVVEVEPVDTNGGEGLSPAVARHLDEVSARVKGAVIAGDKA